MQDPSIEVILVMLGTFPKAFFQAATSLTWNFPRANFQSLLAVVLTPYHVLAAALCPIACSSPSARLHNLFYPQPSAPMTACGAPEGQHNRFENCKFGKVPLTKLSLGKSSLGKCLWKNT